ncbi:MAG: hypothetical protein H0X65_17555, partial [Gemmatimonadetes bacterium]|nr:hypothetical protein [Gemmatimonadota bacterium]
YLMCDDPSPDPAVLFHAVDETITTALHEIVERNRGRGYGLLAATLATALDRLHTP